MATNGRFSSAPIGPLARRIAVEQIDALFATVTLGVCAAGVSAVLLIIVLQYLRAVDPWTGIPWASYIVICAAAHILLRRAYRYSRLADRQWRMWAVGFSAICAAEGVGWGWAPIGLTTAGGFEIELIVVLATLAMAAGAIPTFGFYLPAFFALFLPATIPFLIASIISADPVEHACALLMLVYVPGMGGVGILANRSFKQLVSLRIRTEAMAVDLQRQKDIAERASAAKTTFLAAASHDLRQPLHALGLFVGALRGITMPPEAKRLIEQIEVSTSAMDGLFTALLDISRLDAGIVEVHRRRFSIGSLMDRVCPDYVAEATAKGVSLVWKRCTAIIDSDPVLVERILRNLLSNAVRYTDSGRIVVGCRRRGAGILVQVWDTGPGIPPHLQDQVFQEYYQMGNAERDRTKGLGLGLAIVRRLSDLLGCELTLCSQPGRGSCFEVSLRLARSAVAEAEAAPADLSAALARGLVVVIDDEVAIREAMLSLLTGWGYDVIAVGSGDEAVQRLSTCPVRPDLVICDYRLRNGENGISVVERLRSEYNEAIPAMLITGDTAPDRLAEAQASNLLLLHKPVPNGKLRAAIVNLIKAAEADNESQAELSTSG